MKWEIIGVVCSVLVIQTVAYSNGPPESVCGTLTPAHGHTTQPLPSPYTITLNTNQYSANSKVIVTLEGTNSDNIKGFLIYARKADGSAPTTQIGSFSPSGSTTSTQVEDKCGSGSNKGMSHAQQINQKTVTLEWTAPSTLQGHIEFIYTIVKDKATYWVGATSASVSDGTITSTTMPTTTTEAQPLAQPITLKGCADTKSCFKPSTCTETNCAYLVSYAKQSGDTVKFELKVPGIKPGQFAAVGIAEGPTMSKVTVIACQSDSSGAASVQQYFAESKSGVEKITKTGPASGSSEASVYGGMMSCTFMYNNDVAKADTTKFKDLSSGEYHISVAYGNVVNGEITQHPVTPTRSKAVNLYTTTHTNLEGVVSALIKAHGCIMVFAWLFCASIGMILARYYKPMWVSSKACGQKVWFSYHRALMLTTMFSTLIGLILILIYNDGKWSAISTSPGIGDQLPQSAHPIIGLIAIICCILNPLLAAFRCHPDDKNRPFFNWFHWFFGTVAHVFAIVAIFLGMLFQTAHVPAWLVYVMMGWCLFHVLCEFILEIHQCCMYDKNRDRQEQFQMVSKGESSTPEPKYAGRRFKCGMFIVYTVVTTIFAIAIIVLIAVWTNL